MRIEGGCLCGAVRYLAKGEPLLRVQCHCRECQYIAGGHPYVAICVPEASFRYTKATPRAFHRRDPAYSVTREFCPVCGTHILGRSPKLPGSVSIKVGTLDDPAVFGQAQLVIFTVERQSFHHVPEGVPTFERTPA